MNGGVKILLERMSTHPEEFHGDYNKWIEVINKFEKFFTASERAMINGALTNIRRGEFTSLVMQELLREPIPVEVDPETYTIKTTGRYSNTGVTLTLQDIKESALDTFKETYKQEIEELVRKKGIHK